MVVEAMGEILPRNSKLYLAIDHAVAAEGSWYRWYIESGGIEKVQSAATTT